MTKGLTLIDVYARLGAACREAGSQKAWAQRHGISVQYVSDVLNARSDPGATMLRALGLEKQVQYVELRTYPCRPDKENPSVGAPGLRATQSIGTRT